MWKAEKASKDKQPYEWLRHNSTVEFVDFIRKTLKTGSQPVLTVKGRYGGTYAHWQIAMAYATHSLRISPLRSQEPNERMSSDILE